MARQSIGLLVMAYGTPAHMSELAAYYTHIRQGKPPSDEQLEALRKRYQAIGGSSPLARITHEQAQRLAQHLNDRFADRHFKPYPGFKHVRPFVEDAVQAMHADGVAQAISIIMAPHHSDSSTQSYSTRALDAAAQHAAPALYTIAHWHRQPRFAALWAARIRSMLSALSGTQRQQTLVLFSAHSLPAQAPGARDYARQVIESARQIAAAAAIPHHEHAWQSAGRTSESWLGPDILDVIRQAWNQGGYRTFLICPIGFVADHLEVLYDNDVECRTLIEELGGRYLRPPMPNADDAFIACLGDAVADALNEMAPAAA